MVKSKNNELTKKQLKEIEKWLKLKDKEEKELLKRNDPKNIYCFTGDVPKGKFRGSMKQCAEKGEIGYWGQNKADINIVNLSSSKRTKEQPLSKMEKDLDKMKIQYASLKGKQKNITRNLPYEKDSNIKLQMQEQLSKFQDEEKELKKKMQSLKAKIDAKKPKVQKVEKVEQIKEEPVFEEKIKYEIPVQKDFENLSIEEMITLNKELKAITKELENKLDSGEVDEEEEEEYGETIVQNMKDIKKLTKLIKEYTQGENIPSMKEDIFFTKEEIKPKLTKQEMEDFLKFAKLKKESFSKGLEESKAKFKDVKKKIENIINQKNTKEKLENIESKLDIILPNVDDIKKGENKQIIKELATIMTTIKNSFFPDLFIFYLPLIFNNSCLVIPIQSEKCAKSYIKDIRIDGIFNFSQMITIIKIGVDGWDQSCLYNQKSTIEGDEYIMLINDDLVETIKNCDKQFILIHLSINNGENANHANGILIDKVNKTLEHYEPQGYFYKSEDYGYGEWYDEVNDLLKRFAKKLKLKFISSENTILDDKIIKKLNPYSQFSTVGIQFIEGNLGYYGFCQIWTFYYFYVRVSNPNYNTKQIYEKLYAFSNYDPNLLAYSVFYFIQNFYNEFIVFLKNNNIDAVIMYQKEEESKFAKQIRDSLNALANLYIAKQNEQQLEPQPQQQPQSQPQPQPQPQSQLEKSKMSPADYKLLEQLAKEGERRQREKKEEDADLARLQDIFKNFYN